MRKISGFLIIFLVLSCALNAQDEGHYFVLQKFRIEIPEGGSASERDSLVLSWVNAVQSKSDQLIRVTNLRHVYTEDSHDWFIIWEITSWEGIKTVGDIKRNEYSPALKKYLVSHSDEIYQALSN